jgi:hypothetical protein
MLANIQERRFWRFGGWPELCPVLFSLPLGLLIVMPRARELSDSEFSQIDFHGFIERDGYRVPVEAKSNSFGWLKGRLVAIDYGN